MPADISIVNGLAEAMYANKPAWHGLGQVLYQDSNHAPNSEEAIMASGLGWIVEKQKMFLANGKEIKNKWATVRTDIDAPLGVVGNRYTVQQNVECFQFLDSLLQDGIMRYESAIALDGGRKVALLARMPEYDIIADGDTSLRYLMFSTTHDGSGSMTVAPTNIRVVCANTLKAALDGARNNKMTIRHTASKNQRLKMVAQWISQFNSNFTLYADAAKKLAEKKVPSKQHYTDYINALYPSNPEMSSRQLSNIAEKIALVRSAFIHPSNALESIQGTWWQLVNAVTYTIDHNTQYRIRSSYSNKERMLAEKRFSDIIDGRGADFKEKAFSLALEMAG
jgi:phage/plasmid-like protein (TIGR03299 family)